MLPVCRKVVAFSARYCSETSVDRDLVLGGCNLRPGRLDSGIASPEWLLPD